MFNRKRARGGPNAPFRFAAIQHLALLFCLCIFLLSYVDARAGSDQVIAQGDNGFRVTAQDVASVKEFFEKNTPFQTTDKEYRRYTIQVLLFAREAGKLGLTPPESFSPISPIHTKIALADLYLRKELNDYRLDPIVVESYYRAYPEMFRRTDSSGRGPWTEDELRPLEEVQEDIARTLKQKVQKRLAQEIYVRLIEQHHVSIKE